MAKNVDGVGCKAFCNLFPAIPSGSFWLIALSSAILAGTMCILVAVIVPETYGPLLLKRRAQALSKLTGHIYVSKLMKDEPSITLTGKLKTALSRPWLMLFHEPIVLILTIYLALLYGTVSAPPIRSRCVANEY